MTKIIKTIQQEKYVTEFAANFQIKSQKPIPSSATGYPVNLEETNPS